MCRIISCFIYYVNFVVGNNNYGFKLKKIVLNNIIMTQNYSEMKSLSSILFKHNQEKYN